MGKVQTRQRLARIPNRVIYRLVAVTSAAGKAFLDMLGVFAEFETNLRRERQMDGIVKAKAAGVYKGSKPSIDPAKVRELQAAGMGATKIASRLGIGWASVYRVMGEGVGQETSAAA